MTELVAALLVVSAGWVAVARRGRWLGWAGAGALLGVAALVRPTSLLVLALFPFLEPGNLLRRMRATAIAGACALVLIAPWTLRNCRTLDGCALISTNGGWNLAIGAITRTGRFETLRASDGCRVVTGQVQQDRCWRQVGFEKILADPIAWLKLAPKKLAETFDHESFAIEYLHEADPIAWTERRRIAGRELLTAVHRLLLVAAAFGAVALPVRAGERRVAFGVQAALAGVVAMFALYALGSERHPFYAFVLFIPLAALLPIPGRPVLGPGGLFTVGTVLAVAVTHVVFFGEDRYHLIATPFLCALAAAALRPLSGSGEPPGVPAGAVPSPVS
jgi:hypothetical protein